MGSKPPPAPAESVACRLRDHMRRARAHAGDEPRLTTAALQARISGLNRDHWIAGAASAIQLRIAESCTIPRRNLARFAVIEQPSPARAAGAHRPLWPRR